MARKIRPTLYEVARRHSPHLRSKPPKAEPPRKVDRPSEPPAPPAAPPPPVEPPRPIAAEPPRSTSVIADGPIRSSPVPPNTLWATGNRGPLIVVATASAIVVMFILFALIQRFAGAPAETPMAAPPVAATNHAAQGAPQLAEDTQTPAPPEDAADDSSQPAQPPAPTVELKRGYDYVFIQYFPKSKGRTAEKVAIFLQQHDVPCAIYMGPRDIRLIATEPFLIQQDDRRAAAAERTRSRELINKIEQLGKENRPENYTLDQVSLKPIR